MNTPTASLQENLLTLLCFDQKSIPLIVNSVTPDLFESEIFRLIASKAINYYETFKEPIKDHLPDEFTDILEGLDTRKAKLYSDIFNNLYYAKESINREYTLSQLEKFIRQQSLKKGITLAAQLIKEDKIEDAEVVLDEHIKKRLPVFDVGTDFNADRSKVFKFLTTSNNYYRMGIKHLDLLGICPAPKELFTLVARPGFGKSWFLIHVGKFALMQRKKVVHITLELSEERVSSRYLQNLFSITKRSIQETRSPIFVYDRDNPNKLIDIDFEHLTKLRSLQDVGIEDFLNAKLDSFRRMPLIVKEFPTGSLTITGLKAYLNALERFHNFIPDILIVDYADLMYLNTSNLRIDTGRVYKELRGIAVERNIAVVTVSQTNRSGESVKTITREHLAEDYSKVQISDNLVTYNRTFQEYKMGLARLYVDKGRNDRSGDTILVAQNYDIGQFCLKSTLIGNDYWKLGALSEES